MEDNHGDLTIKWEVTESDIADVVSSNTGIPVGKLLDFEKETLLRMEKQLATTVVGQNSAIAAISKCIRLSRSGLRFHDRPLGVFLLLGPTGVGKTELAKALAFNLFRDQNAMLRLDMSEYMEAHSVSRLIGAPPGYVGHEEGGALTDSVRKKPYQIVLMDEFEKAHPAVGNLLLQVFDEGRLSDSKGNTADFNNTVIILTSNLGSEALYADKSLNGTEGIDKIRGKAALQLVNSAFSPELVNRIDEVICFAPLEAESIEKIARIQLGKVEKLLMEKELTLRVSDSATRWLSDTGFDQAYGARPLKRLIQACLLNPLASLFLESKLPTGSCIHVVEKDELPDEAKFKTLHVPTDPGLVNNLRFFLVNK